MRVKLIIGAVAVGILGLVTLGYGAYVLISGAEPVLLWIFSVMLAFTVGVVIGWVVGRYEVRALLAGVDLGVDKVVRSARQIAVIQDRRGPDRDDGPDLDILLPRVEVTHRNLLESEDVRVDL